MHVIPFAVPRIRRVPLLLLSLSLIGCATGGGVNFVPPARPAQFSMADIPWGIAADSVKALIEPRGYNYNRIDEDGDLWFDGVLNRTPTRIFAFMAEGKLVKLRMLLITEDSAAVPTYRTTLAELVKRFGAPKESVEEYEAPYRKGDQRQIEAILSGKATIKSHWLPPASTRLSFLEVGVGDKAVVYVDYDGPSWQRESVRRRQAQ